jgi:(1->4)-alpha-D-glucan 1-alpha-D-glucosylmutase
VPSATYRLQFTPAFTFDHAAAVVPYLARLGVTDIYCSPIFQAKRGSTHGYDICNFGELNPELGGDEAFARLQAALSAHGMGLVQDFVPNHMAVEPVLNTWWRSMLEHGPASPFANFFDVDWTPVKPELLGKILLPFLGDHYGRVLERGELVVEYVGGEFVVRYFDATRPIDPRAYPRILRMGLPGLKSELGDDPALGELLSIMTALDNIPPAIERGPEAVATRLRESRIAKERLAKLIESTPRIGQHIEDGLRELNGAPGHPESFDALHELLEALPFRLAYWKTAVHEINYRRFFDINDLAGLRPEEPAAFQAMHQLLLKLIGEGAVTGVRLDHIDGLFDPAGYIAGLREAAPQAYVVVEKILTGDEQLPAWKVAGTTGYDFLNDVSWLLFDSRNAQILRRLHRAFTERTDPFREVVYDCKKLITWTSLASELNVLADALNRLSEGDRKTRDFTLDSLREALREVAVCFPVYRTYVGPDGAADGDRQLIDLAVERARRRNPAMESSVFDFVRTNLVAERNGASEEQYQARLRFAMKFQQYTSPLQAKGVEDTAFYRYNALISLNEVGGGPQRVGWTVAQFHAANQTRQSRAPHGMLCTATHDTKRGEDARTRIHVLSEVPRLWRRQVRQWAGLNAAHRTTVDAADAPDRGDEYLFYQTLVGCWPADATQPVAPPELLARVREYMLKATKEAKVHTSWISPNEAYDRAVAKFIEESLTGPTSGEFLSRFLPFQRRIALVGVVNSLAQLVLKATAPGVPDFFQGTEFWDLSLVDPDNRRPVDFDKRAAMLAELEPWVAGSGWPPVGDWLRNWHDGRIKLFVTACVLQLRKRCPDLFLAGEYFPVLTEGELADHVVAYARHHGDEWALVVVPRLCANMTSKKRRFPIGDVWGDTYLRVPPELAGRPARNVFTSAQLVAAPTPGAARLRVADVLSVCPVALLHLRPR